ncbi:MoeB/ThiF family adenylyltransferase [Aeribacillus alveayuensis]|uniref:Molybdopterin/thiamine biosynthesis adenylyltransferase n=1 Tax=Aeribacillus alveayuensis TaxID=279215 RepID=A0ABT9VNQ8_9BACI|nr:molybdopterin/thiamine biosynthesis adenylyltransferase [Bacillus alveayuensis]
MMERYSRQILFAPIGEKGQEKLLKSHVLIVGAGALGCASAEMLTRAGVGKLTIIDRDYVDYSNLGRQQLYTEEDAKQSLPKAIAAKKHLQEINKEITIRAVVGDFTPSNAEGLLERVDLILDGTDNFETRFLINDLSMKKNIPWIYGACLKSYGMSVSIIPKETPCLTCLMKAIPHDGMTCDTVGVIAPVVQMVASYQVTETIKYLVGQPVSKELVSFDVWNRQHSIVDMAKLKKEDCPSCGQNATYPYLTEERGMKTAVLCGRNTVQIRPNTTEALSLKEVAQKLKPLVSDIVGNDFLISFSINPYRIVLFQDGRALIHGTKDINEAKGIYQKYIGA